MSVAEDAGQQAEPRSPMPSVDKALRAVMELAEAGVEGLALADLADRLAVNRSSLHVTLRALRFRNFVDQDRGSGRYILGSSLLAAANLYYRNFDLRGALRPVLVHLAAELNEVFHLAILDGTELLYLEKVESLRPIQPGTRIGYRLPALTTALGRALVGATFEDFEDFHRRFEGSLDPRTDAAPQSLEAEWEEIERAQRVGHARDIEHNVEGLAAVAVALRLNGSPAAAVSIVTLAPDFYAKGEDYYAETLRSRLAANLPRQLELVAPTDPAAPVTAPRSGGRGRGPDRGR